MLLLKYQYTVGSKNNLKFTDKIDLEDNRRIHIQTTEKYKSQMYNFFGTIDGHKRDKKTSNCPQHNIQKTKD